MQPLKVQEASEQKSINSTTLAEVRKELATLCYYMKHIEGVYHHQMKDYQKHSEARADLTKSNIIIK